MLLPLATTIFFLADCERIRVPALEGVRRLILGSVCNNAGDLTSAQSNYLAAIDEGEALGDVHASAFASYELGMLVCKNASTMTVRIKPQLSTHSRILWQKRDHKVDTR